MTKDNKELLRGHRQARQTCCLLNVVVRTDSSRQSKYSIKISPQTHRLCLLSSQWIRRKWRPTLDLLSLVYRQPVHSYTLTPLRLLTVQQSSWLPSSSSSEITLMAGAALLCIGTKNIITGICINTMGGRERSFYHLTEARAAQTKDFKCRAPLRAH